MGASPAGVRLCCPHHQLGSGSRTGGLAWQKSHVQQRMRSCVRGCTYKPRPLRTSSPCRLVRRVTAPGDSVPAGQESERPQGEPAKEFICTVYTACFDPFWSRSLSFVLQASECWTGPSPTAWRPSPSTSTIRSTTSTAAGEPQGDPEPGHADTQRRAVGPALPGDGVTVCG